MMVPQQGQTYLRELDPPPFREPFSGLVRGRTRQNPDLPRDFTKASACGFRVVLCHPYFSPFSTVSPWASAVSLNIVLKVLKVNHFVKQGSTGFFKGAVQVFGAQVDFVIAAFLGAVLPCLPTSTPPIGPTGMIRGNGDHRLFQLPFKEGFVEL